MLYFLTWLLSWENFYFSTEFSTVCNSVKPIPQNEFRKHEESKEDIKSVFIYFLINCISASNHLDKMHTNFVLIWDTPFLTLKCPPSNNGLFKAFPITYMTWTFHRMRSLILILAKNKSIFRHFYPTTTAQPNTTWNGYGLLVLYNSYVLIRKISQWLATPHGMTEITGSDPRSLWFAKEINDALALRPKYLTGNKCRYAKEINDTCALRAK